MNRSWLGEERYGMWEAGREQQAEGTECAKAGGERKAQHVKLVRLECNEHEKKSGTEEKGVVSKTQTVQGTSLY